MDSKTSKHQKDLSTTSVFWDNYQEAGEEGRSASWWDSPVIMAHCQRLITGDAHMNVYQFLKKCLQGRLLEKGISICSGSGDFERTAIDNGLCRKIDAWELSEARVEEGRKMAKKGDYAIRFHKEDVNQAIFKPDHYDIFFAWSALHHIENLEGVIANAEKCLKKNGVLVAQEYVGPDRFQWSEKQVEILNRVLNRLPDRLKTDPETGIVKEKILRPTIAHMKKTDPSEAVRSSEIIPVLRKHFKIRVLRYFGGAVFHPLFNDIMVNFDHKNEDDVALIEMILLLEQVLAEEKVIDNDYAILVAERK